MGLVKEKTSISRTLCLVNVWPKWHPPPHSLLECNCNASVFYDRSELGLGAILRDDMGALIAYKGL